MKRNVGIGFVALALALAWLAYYLVRPLPVEPSPAEFRCYDLGEGEYVALEAPRQAFGIGLAYAGHIQETAAEFDASAIPPVFAKSPQAAVRTDAEVRLPTSDELFEAADALEPGLGETLRSDFPSLSPLLDYEVEMGFVLLEDIDPSQLDDPAFSPRLGFFIANDLSARSLAILGEGKPNRYEYWGVSKSLPGFMPLADKAWTPEKAEPNGIPCVEIETIVNGEVRQRQSTEDLIYTPVQMLRFIHAEFPDVALDEGTVVLSGTPGGVAMATPRWLVRLGNLFGLSRFKKLAVKLDADASRFLGVGDRVTTRGQGLGKVTVTIVP